MTIPNGVVLYVGSIMPRSNCSIPNKYEAPCDEMSTGLRTLRFPIDAVNPATIELLRVKGRASEDAFGVCETACMTDCESRDDFVQHLTTAQPWLFSYLVMLLGDIHDANNVLQEANMKLWTKANDFRPGTNFRAWAREIAYYCALSFSRDRRRERLVVDYSLVENIVAKTDTEEIDPRRLALRHCLSELDDRNLALLRQRYRDETPLSRIAETEQKTEAAVKMSLRRLRGALLRCIESRMATTP